MFEICKIEPTKRTRTVFSPNIDIHETDDGLILTADLPGVKREDLSVDVKNSVLEIRAKGTAIPPPNAKLVYAEYRSGDFQRSFILSEDVEIDEIRAELKDGVLTLFVPKAKRLRPRTIPVSAK